MAMCMSCEGSSIDERRVISVLEVSHDCVHSLPLAATNRLTAYLRTKPNPLVLDSICPEIQDTMDPMAIIGAASSLIVSFARVSKSLSDIKSSFDKAPIAIASMMTECKTISAVLTRLQNLTLGNPVALSPRLMTPETLIESFDDALTGCMLVLSALEAQLQRLIEGEKPETTGFVTRVRLLWNEEAMSQLLGHLRGQHTAISTLIALFQA